MKSTDSQGHKKAVALEYDESMGAPRVTAKGEGFLAEKILETAAKHEIVSYCDETLLRSLMTLSVGENIPSELYEIVAQVLVFIRKAEKGAQTRPRDL